MVVHYLHGQTGQFTVWANGTQNSGQVNFIPESCFSFAKISSFNRKTAAKALNWYQRWLWRNGTRISVPSRKNKTTFSDVLLLREIFWWNDSKSRVPFTSQPDFSETFLHMVNNKRLARFSIPFLRRNLSWELKLGVSNTERRKQLLRSGYLSPHLRFTIE